MYIHLHLYEDSKINKIKLDDLSKTLPVADLQKRIEEEHNIPVNLQKLIHKGKIITGDNGETLFHFNVNYNETIQVHRRSVLGSLDNVESKASEETKEVTQKVNEEILEDCESDYFIVGDAVDVRDLEEGSETIGAYFEAKIKRITKNVNSDGGSDDGLSYHVLYDKWPLDDTDYRLSSLNIRPRASQLVKLEDLKPDQKILVNYNQRDPEKLGEWFAADVKEVNTRRKTLICTIYVGVDNIPLPDTEIHQTSQIFQLEESCLRDGRSQVIKVSVERKHTIECEDCQDDEKKKCKECGCNKCGKKNSPETLIICDECQLNFHMKCIGLSSLPEDDFYCSSCKREDTTIKPGDKLVSKKLKNAPSQVKEQKRDWGRGFACAGRSKTNDKVTNNFKGQVPGTEVGMTWFKRIQLSENGIHRPPVAGIHANEKDGAMSIVLNGGYEDDTDEGDEFWYTGSGGRDLSGNRRTNEQSFDQELTAGNRGLAMNCNVPVNENGAEAKDWKSGIPVRVVRGAKLRKHYPKFAPQEGYRYDGLYKVTRYFKSKGKSGFFVWRYVLRRDDPSPAPWTQEGKKIASEKGWTMIYPEGYQPPPPKEEKVKGAKKRKLEEGGDKENAQPKAKKATSFKVSEAVKKLAAKDKHNSKTWKEFFTREFETQISFQESLEEVFGCSICLGLVTVPLVLSCQHSMCSDCWDRFSKTDGDKVCPMCRAELKGDMPENKELRTVLNSVFPGYEA